MRIFPGIFVAFDALTFTVSTPFTGALGANAVALPGLPTTLNYLAGCLGWGEPWSLAQRKTLWGNWETLFN